MASSRKKNTWDGHEIDDRLVVQSWDGHGDRAFFKLSHRDDFGVQYDSHEEYCWTPVQLRDGRLISGIVYSFLDSSDCIDAIDNNEWSAVDEWRSQNREYLESLR
jgi:hypothetical protein